MEPLSWHAGFAIAVIGWLAWWDLRYRVAPNYITLPWLAIGFIFAEPGSASMAIGAYLIMSYANFPAGDCKGAACMAMWVPWQIVVPALAVAYVATLVIMETQWYKLYQRAHRWPWLCGFSFALTISAVCSTLFFT